MPSTKSNKKSTRWKSILLTTLLAGTLDLTAASTQAWISSRITPDQLLAYIASGIWGETAYTGGSEVLFFGAFFHFLIVFTIVACFFWLYPRWAFLQKNAFLNAILIGVTAWLITTQIVIPLSKIPTQNPQWPDMVFAIIILIACIGFPIALIVKK